MLLLLGDWYWEISLKLQLVDIWLIMELYFLLSIDQVFEVLVYLIVQLIFYD